MSPTPTDDQNAPAGVPRASGDEPFNAHGDLEHGMCSPRERG